jgi:response regulator RpfG family c-di-GMP phosphodiesterase
MMRILLVEDEPDMREPLVFLCESLGDVEVIEAGSGNEAIRILEKRKDIDAIVSDYTMPQGTGGDLYKHVKASGLQIPFVLCSAHRPESLKEFKDEKIAGFVEKPFVNEPLKHLLLQLIAKKEASQLLKGGTSAEASAQGGDIPGFCRIRLVSLKRMSTLAADLYLKLGEKKYVKIVNRGDCFEWDDLDRFAAKGIEYLYLPKESAAVFLEKLTREVLSLKSAKENSPKESRALSKKIQSIVHELSMDLGFTPEVQELAKANVSLALSTLESIPELRELLREVLQDRSNYSSAHSVAVGNIACGIALQMKWPSDNTLFKLALAAFLHDITLSNQELAQVRDEEELLFHVLQSKKFTETEVHAFREHPQKAASLVAKFENIPPDVDTIIAQHHEMPDGKGFPGRLVSARISPLACVFIIAHDIVSEYWRKEDAFDIGAFLQSREAQYSSGYFKKIALSIATNSTAK